MFVSNYIAIFALQNSKNSNLKHKITETMNEQDITQPEDCAGCQLSSCCKINRDAPMQPRAIILAYVVPFILVVAVLVAVIELSGNEAAGAIASLASLIPYYIILHFLDKRKCLIEKSKN